MVQRLSVLTILGICSLEDIKNKKIHTKWLLIFAAEALFFWFYERRHPAIELLPAVLPGLFILLSAFITKGSIGEGDGMLLMVIGIFLGGTYAFRLFIYALFLSGGYALFLCIIRKKNRKYEIAFVPFLLLAFIGEYILTNY